MQSIGRAEFSATTDGGGGVGLSTALTPPTPKDLRTEIVRRPETIDTPVVHAAGTTVIDTYTSVRRATGRGTSVSSS